MASATRKVAIVTGSNTGIGLEIARGLAKQGHHVAITARDSIKGQKALQNLVSGGISPSQLELFQVDFSSQTSIKRFVEEFKRGHQELHILVNNAASPGPQTKQITDEGVEYTFATNVVSYFMLSHLLSDLLAASQPARIVNVASNYAGGMDLQDINFERRRYDNNEAYRNTKQADRLLSWVLADKLKAQGVTVNACHPGVINTQLLDGLGFYSTQTPETGAQTPLWLASSPQLEGVTGKYYDNKQERQCSFKSNKQAQQELWQSLLTLTKLDDLN